MNLDWKKLKEQIQSEPRKTLRFVIGLSVTLLSLWVMVFLQAETGSGREYVEVGNLSQIRTDSAAGAAMTVPGNESGQSFPKFFLGLIVAGSAAGLFWYKRRNRQPGRQVPKENPNRFSLIEKIEIAPGQSLALVNVGAEYWIVGTGNENILLLKSFKKEEWKAGSEPSEKLTCEPANETGEQPKGHSKNEFLTILNSFSGNGQSTVNGFFS